MLSGRYAYIQLEKGEGQRLITSLSNKNGSIGLVYETGDLGDQIGILFDYGMNICDNLQASLSVDYSRYRFEEIYEYENQLANAVRLNYNFSRHWRTNVEYQWLTNRFKKSDQRILNHIHYIW